MKYAKLIAGGALALVVVGAGGYLIGKREERNASQVAVADALASKTLIVIRLNVQTLTAMRQKKPDLVNDLELWTVLQLSQIEPTTFAKGAVAEHLYPETLELVKAYQKQFPDTLINPEKNPTIARAFRP